MHEPISPQRRSSDLIDIFNEYSILGEGADTELYSSDNKLLDL